MNFGQGLPLSRILFNKYDKDGSGSIDMQEFGNLCYDKGHHMEEDELKVAWAIVDVDGSGHVSFDEFQEWWKSKKRFEDLKVCERDPEKWCQVVELFRYYDKDNSGALDNAEFKELHAALLKQNYPIADNFEDCIREVELGGDNLISFNEFLAWFIRIGVFGEPPKKVC